MTHTHLTEVRSRATWGALRVVRQGSSRTTTTVGHCRARCVLGAPKAKRDDKDEAETTAERALCAVGRKRRRTRAKANESEGERERRRTRAKANESEGERERRRTRAKANEREGERERRRTRAKANESGTKPTRRHERVLQHNRERNVD